MANPVISEIKYLGSGTLDMLEVRVPDDYPNPENLVMVIYDRTHNGSTTNSPSANDIYNVTAQGNLYTEDGNADGNDDDGILHYTFGSSENGTEIKLHAQDAVGLYDSVTGETFGLYSFGAPYTVSTASGDPFAGEDATELDTTGQVSGTSSLEREPGGDYVLNTAPDPGESYVCFTKGTQILTPWGPRPIEDLRQGDFILTKDIGVQMIRWIGSRRFPNLSHGQTDLQPIVIKAHAFGPDCPSRDIRLSPNHAVLLSSWKNSMHYGADELLTPAKAMLSADYAYQARDNDVTYYHILLDSHGLILADDMWCESLFLGDESLSMVPESQREEIFEIFPKVRSDLSVYGQKIRPILGAKDLAFF